MAMKEKSTRCRSKCINETFEATTSVDSTAVEEKLFRVDEVEDEPVVFFCAKCKLPIGDSLSWDGVDDGENQIRLKRVTDNVLIGKETRLLEVGNQSQCLVTDLICRGCRSMLGLIYKSTPRSLDNKRFTFCLSVADIDSYVLGSANQMLAAEVPNEQPVTLEYRSTVEQQLTEMKMLVVSMAQRLEVIETGLQEERDDGDGH